jgi:hypothetical protein
MDTTKVYPCVDLHDIDLTQTSIRSCQTSLRFAGHNRDSYHEDVFHVLIVASYAGYEPRTGRNDIRGRSSCDTYRATTIPPDNQADSRSVSQIEICPCQKPTPNVDHGLTDEVI